MLAIPEGSTRSIVVSQTANLAVSPGTSKDYEYRFHTVIAPAQIPSPQTPTSPILGQAAHGSTTCNGYFRLPAPHSNTPTVSSQLSAVVAGRKRLGFFNSSIAIGKHAMTHRLNSGSPSPRRDV